MEHARAGGMVVVRLHDGEPVMASLAAAWRESRWRCGFVLSGVGMLRDIELGFFQRGKGYVTTSLDGPRELLGVCGNIVVHDGAPFLHLHVTLADARKRAVGGHLLHARAHVTGEFALLRSPVQFFRQREDTGLPGMRIAGRHGRTPRPRVR